MHQMKLQEKFFLLIKSGQKNIELRLWDEKRQKIKAGDIIEFSNCSNLSEKFRTTVTKLHLAQDFTALCSQIDCRTAGFSSPEELAAVLADFYPPKLQKEYGVVGIEIRLNAPTMLE